MKKDIFPWLIDISRYLKQLVFPYKEISSRDLKK